MTPAAGTRAARPRPSRGEWALVALLLAAHAGLVSWGIARNSVTYDENYHVPAGVAIWTAGDPGVSPVNPPLVKAMFGAAALAAGARPPAAAALATRDQRVVAERFMRDNATGYVRIFTAARAVNVLLSVLLGLQLWRIARSMHGVSGGAAALVLWAFAPEALAHAGLATLDVATALGWLLGAEALVRVIRGGGFRDAGWLLLVTAGFMLTRFTAVLLAPLALSIWAIEAARGRAAAPGRIAAALVCAGLAGLLALWAGYGAHVASRPLREQTFRSQRLLALQRAAPAWRPPVADDLLVGFDRQSYDSEPHHLAAFALGRVTAEPIRWYFPFAIAVKWPLGLLAAMLLRLALAVRRPKPGDGAWVPIAALAYLLPAMFGANLNAGVRYVLPMLPLACIWAGGLADSPPGAMPGAWRRRGALAAYACAFVVVLESAPAGPWWLSFFNRAAGDPERRDWVLNDSNVDWGQGLIALRDELRARGIGKIHLAYHGTTDPSIYGIDYVPYFGGRAGPESNWLAVSSYFFVGLPQSMMTPTGPTPEVHVLDMRALWARPAAAQPAGCLWLYKVR